ASAIPSCRILDADPFANRFLQKLLDQRLVCAKLANCHRSVQPFALQLNLLQHAIQLLGIRLAVLLAQHVREAFGCYRSGGGIIAHLDLLAEWTPAGVYFHDALPASCTNLV